MAGTMEYFSLERHVPLNEQERECLSSGKSVADIATIINFVQYDARPRRHIRDVIAASIFAMERINMVVECFKVRSIGVAEMLKSAMAADPYVCKADRILLLQDLVEFQSTIKAVVEEQHGPPHIVELRRILQPMTVVFDANGSLSRRLEIALVAAGANSISISPSPTGFVIDVCGPNSEVHFRSTFQNMGLTNIPDIKYRQNDDIDEHSDSEY
jgi:hypothetical protein